jgi:hypothetical protein
MRKSIFSLEEEMLKMPQTDLPIKDHFSTGIYAREMFIPKGTVLTGKLHKSDHLNIMLYGDIEIATEDGLMRMNTPCIIESKKGTKRAGYAHEDTVWITFHVTDETDIAKIEDEVIADNPHKYLALLDKGEL